jgi:hypothetical protein
MCRDAEKMNAEPTTSDIVKALRICNSSTPCKNCPGYKNGELCVSLSFKAADRLEQQEAQNAELRRTRVIESPDAATAYANALELTEAKNLIAEKDKQIAEKDKRIAELNDFEQSQSVKLLARVGELERELAAAKADMHHNDACSVCIGAEQEVCKDCDRECQTCVLDCRCKDCRDESKWEWRGAKGREDD